MKIIGFGLGEFIVLLIIGMAPLLLFFCSCEPQLSREEQRQWEHIKELDRQGLLYPPHKFRLQTGDVKNIGEETEITFHFNPHLFDPSPFPEYVRCEYETSEHYGYLTDVRVEGYSDCEIVHDEFSCKMTLKNRCENFIEGEEGMCEFEKTNNARIIFTHKGNVYEGWLFRYANMNVNTLIQ